MGMIGNTPYQGQIGSGNIQDGSIDTIDIKDAAVTTAKIGSGQVTNDKLADNAVGTVDIQDGAVTSAKLASGVAVANLGYTPVNKTGDIISGELSVQYIRSTQQSGGVKWYGDIDAAKWSTKLGGYFLSFMNPSTDSTNLEGTPINQDGLSWKVKARLNQFGGFEVGQGIKFPVTQNPSSDANTLDDYEEGTWTPTAFVTYSGPGTTVTTTQSSGFYVKVGKKVTCWFQLAMNVTNAGGNIGFYGLPFSAAELSMGAVTAGSARQDNVAGTMFNLEGIAGASVSVMRKYDNSGVDNGAPIMKGWFTYFTA